MITDSQKLDTLLILPDHGGTPIPVVFPSAHAIQMLKLQSEWKQLILTLQVRGATVHPQTVTEHSELL